MTYLERITYLTGNFAQLMQYVIKSAYRVTVLTEVKSNPNSYVSRSDALSAAESRVNSLLTENMYKGSDQLLAYFENKGLSVRDYKEFSSLLKKRDYIMNYFYIDSSSALAREDVAVYESKITELNEYCERLIKLNQNLAKSANRLTDDF